MSYIFFNLIVSIVGSILEHYIDFELFESKLVWFENKLWVIFKCTSHKAIHSCTHSTKIYQLPTMCRHCAGCWQIDTGMRKTVPIFKEHIVYLSGERDLYMNNSNKRLHLLMIEMVKGNGGIWKWSWQYLFHKGSP